MSKYLWISNLVNDKENLILKDDIIPLPNSNNLLELDNLFSNSFVIYRGSSLIFRAVIAGLIPIYLEKGTEIDVLKILNISYNRLNISKNINDKYLNKLAINNHSRKLIKDLFYPVNMSVMSDVL